MRMFLFLVGGGCCSCARTAAPQTCAVEAQADLAVFATSLPATFIPRPTRIIVHVESVGIHFHSEKARRLVRVSSTCMIPQKLNLISVPQAATPRTSDAAAGVKERAPLRPPPAPPRPPASTRTADPARGVAVTTGALAEPLSVQAAAS